jgi:hypothetical protein
MAFNIYTFSMLISLGFFIIILELVRRQKLKEEYSILWLVISISMVIISFVHNLLERMATALGIHYAPALLFLIGFIFSITLILHLTVIISKHSSQYIRTVQELALLKQRVYEMEKVLKSGMNNE